MNPPPEGRAVAGVKGDTRVLALLGDPVRHSLSPAMQNAAFVAAGVNGVYVTLRCGDGDLPGLLRGLARAGGGGNVTLPHKERAAAAVEEATSAVRRTGACNTFWLEEGRVHGDNTDVEGLRRALHALLDQDLQGARVLLLGAGGAARAALTVLMDESAGAVHILNRTLSRARNLAQRLGDANTRVLESREALAGRRYDLVVNATRLGLDPEDPLPMEVDEVDRVGAILDLVYGPEETALVRRARERDIPAADGGEMLLQQGAVAFERWWKRPAPVEVMRRTFEAHRSSDPPQSGEPDGGGVAR